MLSLLLVHFLTIFFLAKATNYSANKTSIEEYFLGDLEAHISLRTKTKASITRVVHDLLNPIINEKLFEEDGDIVKIIFENNGTDSIQREQHDLIYAFLHPTHGQPMLKFYLLRSSAKIENKIGRSSLNILLVDSLASYLKIYEFLRDGDFQNDAYFLVILNYMDEDWFTVAKKIFIKAWQRYMINTSLMFLSNTEDDVKIFTYFPFTESHCEQIEPMLIQRIREGKWENDATVFPYKLRNFHRCPIKVALLHAPPFMFVDKFKRFGSLKNLEGIEAKLLKVLAVTHNFTIEPVIVDEWGFTKLNNNYTANGAIEAIRDKRANMTLSFFTISAERNSELTPGFPYYTSSVVFVIPPEHKSVSRLMKPLSETVRVAVFSTFCIGVGVIFIASQLHQRWRQLILGHDNHHPYSNLVLSGLGGSLARTPFTNFARFCLISWILLCFMVNNFYLAKYFQFLAQDDDISLADTFEKIAKRKYTIYIRPNWNVFFNEHPELEANTIVLPLNEYPRVEKLMQDPDTSAVLMHTSDFVLYKNKVIYRDKPLIIASQHLVDSQISIYYPNYSCLRHAFNPFLRTLTSNGLIEYWTKKYIDPMYLVQTLKAGHNDMVITNAHLSDIYWVMLGGWLLASFVFVLELLSLKYGILRRFFQ